MTVPHSSHLSHSQHKPHQKHGVATSESQEKAASSAQEAAPDFAVLKLHPDLLRGIQHLGFRHPTPIQTQAVPPIMEGKDVIGIAQTGTGKTAAFVLPILHRLMADKGGRHMRTLILVPTRELALQVQENVESLSRYVPVKGVAVFGGVPISPQTTALARGVDIVCATPGRLIDHVYQQHIDFMDLKILVLDEADRMLDMGFLPDIKEIISFLPRERQNLMFSATMSDEISKLTHQILRNPVTIKIGQKVSPAAGIRHAVYPCPRHLKNDLLLRLLAGKEVTSVLVFTRTKRAADKLSQKLQRAGLKVSVLHGDRSQNQRLHALEQFRNGRHQVMVATDIAARGIDVEGITHVINYDVPEAAEDYIHRIGRTARASATGDAFTLVDRAEEHFVVGIERALGTRLPRITLPDFDYRKVAPEHFKPNVPARHPQSHSHSHSSPHSSRHSRPTYRRGR